MEFYTFNGNVDAYAGMSNDGVLIRFKDLIRTYDGDEHLNTIEAIPETYLVFNNLESIDIVIDKLKQAKALLEREMLNYENSEFEYGHDIINRIDDTV